MDKELLDRLTSQIAEASKGLILSPNKWEVEERQRTLEGITTSAQLLKMPEHMIILAKSLGAEQADDPDTAKKFRQIAHSLFGLNIAQGVFEDLISSEQE